MFGLQSTVAELFDKISLQIRKKKIALRKTERTQIALLACLLSVLLLAQIHKRRGIQWPLTQKPTEGGGGARSIPPANLANPQWLNFAPVAKFRTGFISHSGLKIEREISHTFERRNFPQQNIPPAKPPPPVHICTFVHIQLGCMPNVRASKGFFPHRLRTARQGKSCVWKYVSHLCGPAALSQ